MRIEELHISSLIVHIRAEKLDVVRANINLLKGAEVITASPQGKAIVVLEAENQRIIMEVIDQINELDGVLNTGLVYHEFEKREVEHSEEVQ